MTRLPSCLFAFAFIASIIFLDFDSLKGDIAPISSSEISVTADDERKQELPFPTDDHDDVKFVFFVGIEGTGHHLLRTIIRQSPAVKRINQLQIRNDTDELQDLLFPHGLWDAHCNVRGETNVSVLYEDLVKQLRTVHEKATIRNHETDNGDKEPSTTTIFLNVERSMLSYPTNPGACRPMNYADLDALYAACDEDSVSCGHVYLYRDPYQVLQSTTVKRKFNPTILSATKLYYSMLNNIYAQFMEYPERTMACWGFFDDDPIAQEQLHQSMRDLLGWTQQNNEKNFDLVMARAQHHHANSTENKDQAASLTPSSLDIYLQSMIRAHNRTLKLCRDQVGHYRGI